MALVIDPAGDEILALKKATAWKGKRVLEVGCGDGRLTLRLAALGPQHIEAIEADGARLRLARKNLPGRYTERVRYHVGHAESLKYPKSQFDIVIFSWSL